MNYFLKSAHIVALFTKIFSVFPWPFLCTPLSKLILPKCFTDALLFDHLFFFYALSLHSGFYLLNIFKVVSQ